MALIISAGGAEACICLGAGRSQLKDEKLAEAERALIRLQERLASVPADVADEVAGLLPRQAVYRTSWRQAPGTGEFETLADWLAYAAGRAGVQASISLYVDPDELERLGSSIANVVRELADAAAPLFGYCYPEQETLPGNHGGTSAPGDGAGTTINVGGVDVTAEQIAQAIAILQSTGGTAVKQPLQAQGNPLSEMNYHAVAENYLNSHPERAIPPGSPEQHAAHVKSAILAYLAEQLELIGHNTPPRASFDADSLEQRATADRYQLEISQRVYRAIIAAITSGKHVILTGPPGTAKTTLAELTCSLAADAGLCPGYMLTTATADWTTYDTIGGLSPTGSGGGLQFRAGFFLDAARSGNWLVVDELNRSNFDRAFGQLFTVLSGQSVVLPYEDPDSGHRIALVLEGAQGGQPYNATDYAILTIPESWRIIATMNVFDKSLLFEMSFALMRRFAFIEVSSPPVPMYETIWRRELEGLQDEQYSRIDAVLSKLLALRLVKDIGPAVFIDMAKFARRYVQTDSVASAGEPAFQLFYSYLLPQFEGITNQEGRDLFNRVRSSVGQQHQGRLRATLTDVLGVTLPAGPLPPDDADEAYEDAEQTESDNSFPDG